MATLPPSLKKLDLTDVAIEPENLATHSLAKEGSVFVRNCDWLDENGNSLEIGEHEEEDDARFERNCQHIENIETTWGVVLGVLPWPTDKKALAEKSDDDDDDSDVADDSE